MFRVAMLIEDKNLAKLLHALVGVSVGQPEIQPVTTADAGAEYNKYMKYMKALNALNATSEAPAVPSTGTERKAVKDGSMFKKFVAAAMASKKDRFYSSDLKELCKSIGSTESALYWYTTSAVKKGVLLKSRLKGENKFNYFLIAAKAKAYV